MWNHSLHNHIIRKVEEDLAAIRSEEERTNTATGAATVAATGTSSTNWKAEAIKAVVNSQNPEIALETIEIIFQGEQDLKYNLILIQTHKENFLQSAIAIKNIQEVNKENFFEITLAMKNNQQVIGDNQEESNKWLALMSLS